MKRAACGRKLRVPEDGHHQVRTFFAVLRDRNLCVQRVAEAAGINMMTILAWSAKRAGPGLATFVAALNAVGLDLAVVDKETREEVQ